MKYLMVGIHGCPSCVMTKGMLTVWCAGNDHLFEHNYLCDLDIETQSDLMHIAEITDPSGVGRGFEPEDDYVFEGLTDSDVPRIDFAKIDNFRVVPQLFTIDEGVWGYVGGLENILDLCGA